VYSPLRRWTQPGDVVGVVGIGGLGHLAIQFSKALGCKTVAISSSNNKENEAKSFGAVDFVCSANRESMAKYKCVQ
jgi:D-arabinose 1-dehydrogenase-like Zn-dependent alcohol dehydrogenase